jgi:hypothetical protein
VSKQARIRREILKALKEKPKKYNELRAILKGKTLIKHDEELTFALNSLLKDAEIKKDEMFGFYYLPSHMYIEVFERLCAPQNFELKIVSKSPEQYVFCNKRSWSSSGLLKDFIIWKLIRTIAWEKYQKTVFGHHEDKNENIAQTTKMLPEENNGADEASDDFLNPPIDEEFDKKLPQFVEMIIKENKMKFQSAKQEAKEFFEANPFFTNIIAEFILEHEEPTKRIYTSFLLGVFSRLFSEQIVKLIRYLTLASSLEYMKDKTKFEEWTVLERGRLVVLHKLAGQDILHDLHKRDAEIFNDVLDYYTEKLNLAEENHRGFEDSLFEDQMKMISEEAGHDVPSDLAHINEIAAFELKLKNKLEAEIKQDPELFSACKEIANFKVASVAQINVFAANEFHLQAEEGVRDFKRFCRKITKLIKQTPKEVFQKELQEIVEKRDAKTDAQKLLLVLVFFVLENPWWVFPNTEEQIKAILQVFTKKGALKENAEVYIPKCGSPFYVLSLTNGKVKFSDDFEIIDDPEDESEEKLLNTGLPISYFWHHHERGTSLEFWADLLRDITKIKSALREKGMLQRKAVSVKTPEGKTKQQIFYVVKYTEDITKIDEEENDIFGPPPSNAAKKGSRHKPLSDIADDYFHSLL